MRYRPNPFSIKLAELQSEDPEQARKFAEAVGSEFFASPAAGLLAQFLQNVELSALANVKLGKDVDKSIGRMSLVEDIRTFFVSLLPEDDRADGEVVLDAELEEGYLPETGFSVPYPVFTSGE
jgi:hypothetical protein